MPVSQPIPIAGPDWPELLTETPLLSSFQSGWNNLQLLQFRYPEVHLPELSNTQHVLLLPLGCQHVDLTFTLEGKAQHISYAPNDYAKGYIELYPVDVPYSLSSHETVKMMDLIHYYIDPVDLAQIAHEYVDCDRVELISTMKKIDPLMYQLAHALKRGLEAGGDGSQFYADSLATALFAHLLQNYTTRKPHLPSYEDGLAPPKIRQAIEYMQAHLGENLSLGAIADALGMSQYYFCHLFKRSMGVSPHQYLIRQRIEQAKILLKKQQLSVTEIAMECGFSNQSHFAKCFRQQVGVNPKQFRKFL